MIRGQLPDGSYIFAASVRRESASSRTWTTRSTSPRSTTAFRSSKGRISGSFKTGFRATVRRRDFAGPAIPYSPQQSTTLNLFLPSNQLFAPDNIRPTGFQIDEFTRGTDTYSADMNIYAGYGMVDIGVRRPLAA